MALKSRSYVFYLDNVQFYLDVSFIMICLMESLLHQLSGSTLILKKKNKHQKVENLALRLILAAGMGYIQSFVV